MSETVFHQESISSSLRTRGGISSSLRREGGRGASVIHGNWSIPGHGEEYDDCGKFGLKGCQKIHLHHGKGVFAKQFRRSCNRAECPVCYESWSALEAHRAMHRFEVAGKAERIIHVIVSPPKDTHDQDIKKLRAGMYGVAKRAGFKGGLSIFHPFRWRCLSCGLDAERCSCEIHCGMWYYSPHFHILGHGWISNVGEIYQSTGWLVKNLGLRKSLYRTIQYQLSHAGVWITDKREGILPIAKGKRLSITWFGNLSYAKLHVEREVFAEECPECGSKLEFLPWGMVGDPPSFALDVRFSAEALAEGFWISESDQERLIAYHVSIGGV